MIKKKFFYSALVANCFSHYDAILYGMMAPFFAEIFFSDDKIAGLFKIYSIPIITIFTSPIGTIIFGRLVLLWGPPRTLVLSLFGVTLCTFLMGCLPTYSQVGIVAPLLLIFVRVLQSIFLAGESTIASLFLVANSKKKAITSSLYSTSSMCGVALASLVAYFVSISSSPKLYWRLAFFLALFTGIINLILRYYINKDIYTSVEYKKLDLARPEKINWEKNYKIMLKIIIVNGANYLNFVIPFVIFNSLVPLFTKFSMTEMLKMNSMLLVFDLLLLPFFGFIAYKIGAQKLMIISSCAMTLLIVPLFYFLPTASLWQIALIRMIIVIIGAGFSAPSYVWFYSLCKDNNRYLITGLSCVIGAQLLNRTAAPICLKLFGEFNSPLAPAIYIASVSFIAMITLIFTKQETYR